MNDRGYHIACAFLALFILALFILLFTVSTETLIDPRWMS